MRINQEQRDNDLIHANDRSQMKNSGESTFQFVDNRPEAVRQNNLKESANNSLQVKRVAQLQSMANSYALPNHAPIQKKENTTGLPDNLKSGIENLSGYSMDDVKVHYNSDKPTQLQAHAYAQGTDIHLASGQEKHLPHEAWHVVQQKQGRVKTTLQMKDGVNVNNAAALEKEADVMGVQALSFNSPLGKKSTKLNLNTTTTNIIQGKGVKSELLESKVKFENFKEEVTDIDSKADLISKAIYNHYKKPQITNSDGETVFNQDQLITDKTSRGSGVNVEGFKDAAVRLNSWSTTALSASQRLFAELRGAVNIVGTDPKYGLQDLRFGIDTVKEPDVSIGEIGVGNALESKRINSPAQGAVDTHILKGTQQLNKRQTSGNLILYLEIDNKFNPWPFTPVKLQGQIDSGNAPDKEEIRNKAYERLVHYSSKDEKDFYVTVVIKNPDLAGTYEILIRGNPT